MAQLITVRLSKSEHQPLGFRLQGGKDFGTPLVVQKVNGGSAAERAGLQAGDALIRVNNTEVYALRHQEAQDAIRAAGAGLELTVQRGGGTWRPNVTPTGSLPRPGSRPLGAAPTPVTNTSLKATPQPSRAFGSGHNSVAKPFGYMNGTDSVKSVVNKQYNTPVNMYSDKTIAETLSAQTEVLAGGVLGVNFKKNEKTYDAEKSAVFKVLQEEQNDPEPEVSSGAPAPAAAVTGLRHVAAPVTRPDAPLNTGGLPPGQNICEECERLITGVFVRIKDKNLHVECFKCATCGTSLKNQGYYNLNGKLYCDIHAKLIARQNPPATNLEPVTVPPGGRIPTNSYTTPLPPLATNNYTNGSSSLFSPSSNLSGPKPFGSSLGSTYSPSLSPRSAPLSPARPVVAPAPAPPSISAPAPFAPINETQQAPSNVKTEFKSPAEERLIKKMAKMALNGYEIGIQRKIKPANHIQSMADKIQDTVVTKHPLNTESVPSTESSNDYNPRIPISKNFDRGHNPAGSNDKIKDEIVVTQSINNGNCNIPVPPPIPTFNAHLFSLNSPGKHLDIISKSNNHKTETQADSVDKVCFPHNGIGCSNNEDLVKDKRENNTNTIQRKTFEKFLNEISNSQKPDVQNYELKLSFPHNGNGCSNREDLVKDNHENNTNTPQRKTFEKFLKEISNSQKPDVQNCELKLSFPQNDNECSNKEDLVKDKHENNTNTIQRKTFEKFLNEINNSQKPDVQNCELKFDGNLSNTLSKRNIFEKRSEEYGSKGSVDNLSVKNASEISTTKKSNIFDKLGDSGNIKINNEQIDEEHTVKQGLTQNLCDNTLYTYKPIQTNAIDGINTLNKSPEKHENNGIGSLDNNEDGQDTEKEVVVRRRQKKIDRNIDGRRDSHIVARPLSTMTSVDMAEGLYPVCHKCDKAITRGPFITALGRIWCPEHFICVNATCRRPLQDIGFVEENGQLYCEFCFEQYIAPACDKCHAKIKGDCLNAIGKHFHPECFNCVYCGKLFGNNPFFLEDGLPYCEADWNELFTTKCFACGFPVEAGDRWVEALNNNYHSQCFNCTVCKKNLEGQSFFAKGGRPFCKTHAR